MEIEDIHPLRKCKICDIVTPLRYCPNRCLNCIKPRTKLRESLKTCFLKELDLKIPENEEVLDKDPFLVAGYGTNALFNTM